MEERTRTDEVLRGEKLLMEEIERRYPSQWVVLVDVDDANMVTTAGRVYAHGPERRALSPTVKSLRDCAVFWTGPRTGITPWLLAHVVRPV